MQLSDIKHAMATATGQREMREMLSPSLPAGKRTREALTLRDNARWELLGTRVRDEETRFFGHVRGLIVQLIEPVMMVTSPTCLAMDFTSHCLRGRLLAWRCWCHVVVWGRKKVRSRYVETR